MNKTLKYTLFLLLGITVINFGANILLYILDWTYTWPIFGRLMLIIGASFVAAFITTLIVVSTAPVLKNYISTMRQLLRLDTLSHPLLLKLQQDAPSTFQHSLQVANLAHRAAKAINADAFLARIGGYYHDIGKIKDSSYFIENQREDTPKPQVVAPKMMLKKIHGHIKEGVKLAKEYHLPDEVIAFIPEHHGTLFVESLFHQAKIQGLKPKRQDYRYAGPRPLSKETAIVMLADAIESKLRTVEEYTKESISEVVDSIITARAEDKQLQLSGLTEEDLKRIREAFIEGGLIAYHQRLKYPEKTTQAKSV